MINIRQLTRFALKLGWKARRDTDWDELVAYPVYPAVSKAKRESMSIHVPYSGYLSRDEKQDAIKDMIAQLSFGKSQSEVEQAMTFAVQKK